MLKKSPTGNANYYPESTPHGSSGWVPSFSIGPKRSGLANLPEDESRFPATSWFKNLLSSHVQEFVLNSREIRKPSPPGQDLRFKPDGSNLPWVIARLRKDAPDRYRLWIKHVQTAFADINDVDTEEKPEERSLYIVVKYRGGVDVPSWMVSDGTLRLLALTLPAYLPDLTGVYLIEEPENGIHPSAVPAMYQSLRSVYGAQILMATHSPVILSLAEPKQVLCFAKDEDGATDIVRGDKHPALLEWQGETSLGELFAGGVLG